MKITSSTENAITIKDSGMVNLIAAAIALIVGIALYITQPTQMPWYGYLIILAVVIISIFTSKSITFTCDKAAGKAKYQKKSLFGSTTKDLQISDIKSVEMQKSISQSSNRSGNTAGTTINIGQPAQSFIYSLSLRLQDGTSLQLSSNSRGASVIMGNVSIPAVEIGQQLSAFLNVPFTQF